MNGQRGRRKKKQEGMTHAERESRNEAKPFLTEIYVKCPRFSETHCRFLICMRRDDSSRLLAGFRLSPLPVDGYTALHCYVRKTRIRGDLFILSVSASRWRRNAGISHETWCPRETCGVRALSTKHRRINDTRTYSDSY